MTLFDRPTLPQYDSNQLERAKKLEEFRQKFQFDDSVVEGLPISAQVPEEAKAGTGWSLKIVATSYKLRRNWESILEQKDYVFESPLPQKGIPDLVGMLVNSDLLGILGYSDPDLGVALRDKRPSSFEQYFELFKAFDLPVDPEELNDDSAFADYFVAGLNPVMLKRLKTLEDKMALSSEHLSGMASFANDSLEELLEDGRLFVVDYEALDTIEAGTHPEQSKYVYSPIVYLALPKGDDKLEVLGIQVGQDGQSYPLVTPRDQKWDWLIAKTIAKSADVNYHEVITHLGLTHLLIDPIVVATFRQLPPQHPLNTLLLPHFEGTIPINALAVKRLLPEGGKVEQLLAGTIDSAYTVLRTVRRQYGFRANFLPKTFKARGVDADSKLKHYPYRDDGLMVWEAIQDWVSEYVDLYYQNDEEVAGDIELANWVADIVDPKGGRIPDFAPNNRIATKTVLVETLTMIIFTCSAQHAAVNYPQAKAAAVPFQPLAGYAPAPRRKGLSEQDALDFLPPLDRAIKQTHTLTLLGTTYYTKLGDYALGTFDDKRVVPKLWSFQSRLDQIERTIEQRNQSRRTTYDYLKPSLIPQSINI